MKSLIFNLLFFLGVITLTSFTVSEPENKCTLTIKVLEISAIKGDIYIAIYENKKAFDDKNAIVTKRLKVTSTKEEYSVSLPIGEYAVILYQDLNNNKKLDRVFSVPVEPYGVSNNLSGFPSFDSAKFPLEENKTININIKK